ncbi:hypothetical protein [Maribellus maritimus]|uniref:hypothetical protein n=1 Tax=Maribellus maritimus TaxID=2870838 RepID=UPI001EEC40BD|nr:hypothetical protein [Maribellus maritimus]MCG6189044.1 hypothetical protein [Maribellus maritimus]
MKQIQVLLSPIVFLFLLSCEKEPVLRPGFSGDGTLLKEVKISGETYYTYTYNDAGFVLEEKSKFHYSKHKYNSSNQLVHSDNYWDERIASSSSYVLEEAMNRTEWVSPENTERDSYSILYYDRSGQLERSETFRVKNSYTSFLTYSYNTKGRINRRTFYSNNRPSSYDEYHYDAEGNLVKTERYNMLSKDNNELRTTTEYEFDDKHNPYYCFRGLMIPGRNTNLNNIVKETYTIHFEVDDYIEPVQITEYEYEYNSEGYPVKRSDTFEFIYQ